MVPKYPRHIVVVGEGYAEIPPIAGEHDLSFIESAQEHPARNRRSGMATISPAGNVGTSQEVFIPSPSGNQETKKPSSLG